MRQLFNSPEEALNGCGCKKAKAVSNASTTGTLPTASVNKDNPKLIRPVNNNKGKK